MPPFRHLLAVAAVLAVSSATFGCKKGGDTSASEGCEPKDVWTPKTAKVTLAWTDKPTLDKAPADGAYANVGGETFALDKVELWVSKSKDELDLRAKGGPLGPSLSLKGTPKAGLVVDDKFGSNRGHFQVPQKGVTAACFKETTSYNGPNARVVKLLRYDEAAKTADVQFVTMWQEASGAKRQFWAAGTVKGVRVVVL